MALLYIDIAYILLNSQLSNLISFPLKNTLLLTIINILYCIVNISKVKEENKDKVELVVIR